MGRLTDFLKEYDRKPTYGTLVADEADLGPAILGDEIIPFVEVGDPGESALRLPELYTTDAVVLPLAAAVSEPPPEPPAVVHEPRLADPAIFSIRFAPVFAGRPTPHGWGSELVAFHQPDHAVSGQYRSLVHEIAHQLPGAATRLIVIVGAERAAGTTTVLLNLAATLASEGRERTVAVDAAGVGVGVAAKLGLPRGPGLRDVLAQGTPLAWTLHETRLSALRALTWGKPGVRPDAAGIEHVADQLRGESDWVLVDAGAWSGSDEQAAWATAADAVYLVVRDGESADELQRTILDSGATLRGCVVTG